MKKLVAGLGMLSLVAGASVAQAAPVDLDSFAAISCSAGTPLNGISLGDVTGNNGGPTDCWGTFGSEGNPLNTPKDGFLLGGMQFDLVAKEDTPGGLSGTDIGLSVTPSGGALTGDWSYDPTKFSPSAFLITLKAASKPGYAVWLFDGPSAASDIGTWSVAWGHNLSHLSVYEKVPEPSTLILLGTGLALVGLRARRKK